MPLGRAAWPVPFFGDLLEFFDDRLGFIERRARSGDAVRVRLGPRRAVILSHPELVREVFVREARHFVRGVTGEPLRPVLGEGLLLSEGETWRRQRRDIQLNIGSDRTSDWIPAIAGAVRALISRWTDGEERDVHHEMHRLTLDVAARLFLAVESDDGGRLNPTLEAILREDVFKAKIPLGRLRSSVRVPRTARAINELVFGQIQSGRGSFIRALARTTANERELRDQIVTLMFTAQETTAVALTWAWHLLSRNEHVEREFRAEMRRFEGRPRTETRPYLTAVVNETLRLYPPVIGQAREVTLACEIGGLSLRPADLVIFSQWTIQRDGRWFDRPSEYKPERWLDGLEERLHPFAFFPFGGGRRVCVGRALALAILSTAIPMIAGQFQLSARAEHVQVNAVISPKPRGGLPMVLRRLSPSSIGAPAVYA